MTNQLSPFGNESRKRAKVRHPVTLQSTNHRQFHFAKNNAHSHIDSLAKMSFTMGKDAVTNVHHDDLFSSFADDKAHPPKRKKPKKN